ncbi:hypothetical protein APT_00311 [Acetobacter pasteurianus NBRC 101655]|uniref:hypothetical protein n=1 Tax=Acetobacter pasteurianus TaxID=438 RepID=UPI0002458239|nr:hypothetical protein [Acetobacter pasteurianus]BAU37393.1 hypothetical protein APT_00311 [Acetobacter pasteurianus NBRC 101655]CCT59896.1 hypothetical protein APA386B_1826 [Acetobacter pasteurianus 386B]
MSTKNVWGTNLSVIKHLTILPALEAINLGGEAAVNLVTGTGLVESGFVHDRQINGPALGWFQIEPRTHDDIWLNFLHYRSDLANRILSVSGLTGIPEAENLLQNKAYSVCMCRVQYLRTPEPLPSATDAAALSAYHKQHYNTVLGQANAAANTSLFQQAIKA